MSYKSLIADQNQEERYNPYTKQIEYVSVPQELIDGINADIQYTQEQITLLVEDIDTKVNKSEILAEINLSSEGVRIAWDKIRIDGNTIVEWDITATGTITWLILKSPTYTPVWTEWWIIDHQWLTIRWDETILRETILKEWIITVESLVPWNNSRTRLIPWQLVLRSPTWDNRTLRIFNNRLYWANFNTNELYLGNWQHRLWVTSNVLEWNDSNNYYPVMIHDWVTGWAPWATTHKIRFRYWNSEYWIPATAI